MSVILTATEVTDEHAKGYIKGIPGPPTRSGMFGSLGQGEFSQSQPLAIKGNRARHDPGTVKLTAGKRGKTGEKRFSSVLLPRRHSDRLLEIVTERNSPLSRRQILTSSLL